VRYWDTSALVALVIAEAETRRMRLLVEEDPHIVAWAWTSAEFASAVERRARQGELTRDQPRSALTRFTELAEVWDEVTDVPMVCRRALAVLARHPLRAADAAQLGAALAVAPEQGAPLGFVCLDERLLEAAEREGLRPVPRADHASN
jgi:uncharacterized protein